MVPVLKGGSSDEGLAMGERLTRDQPVECERRKKLEKYGVNSNKDMNPVEGSLLIRS